MLRRFAEFDWTHLAEPWANGSFPWDFDLVQPRARDPQYQLLPTSGIAANGKPILDWVGAAAQITRESDGWSVILGAGTSVTYAYRLAAPAIMPEGTSGFSQFSAAQIAATETAIALWESVANVDFVRVGAGYANNATILFGNYFAGAPDASAFAFFPGSRAAGSVDGDVWVNISLATNLDLSLGAFGLQILAHEIGHAIGLSHPGDYNGGAPTYELSASYWQDSRAFTIMSYFGSPNVGGNLPGFSAGPQLHDIAAVQRLYGANVNTRVGDTIYGFNSNTGLAHYSISSATQGVVFAIWDGGGNDTLDLSGYSENADIDLREESHSSAGPTPDNGPATFNMSIARGAVIENGIGGAGDDTLTGNDVANRLEGRAGIDTLIGGGGTDTL
ncbi:MAG: M10 family metallopeptidase C-terminal domain-containing protein, partial [Terricaulis sp.]